MDYSDLIWLSSILGGFVLLFIYALYVARSEIEALDSEKRHLLNEAAAQQQLLYAIREDATALRSLTEKQSEDLHQQNNAFSSRLDGLLQQIQQKQQEVELARQMCRDLPAAQARVLDLERSLAVERQRIDQFIKPMAAAEPETLELSEKKKLPPPSSPLSAVI